VYPLAEEVSTSASRSLVSALSAKASLSAHVATVCPPASMRVITLDRK
jgi:hypothetical protein